MKKIKLKRNGLRTNRKRNNMTIYIYKVTSPSNKYYIGISNNYKKRRLKHISDANNVNSESNSRSYFKRAIRKYGDKLKWEIIDSAQNYDKRTKWFYGDNNAYQAAKKIKDNTFFLLTVLHT